MFKEDYGPILNVLTTIVCLVPFTMPLQVFAWKAHREYKRRHSEWQRRKNEFDEYATKNPAPPPTYMEAPPAPVVRRRSGAEMVIGALSSILVVPLAVANQWLLATSLPVMMPRGKVLLSLPIRDIYATDLAAVAIVLTELGAGIVFLFGLEQFLEAQKSRRKAGTASEEAPEAFPVGMLLVTIAALVVGLIVIAAEWRLAEERARLISGNRTVLISGLIAGAVATGSFLFAALAVESVVGLVALLSGRTPTGRGLKVSYHTFPPLSVPLWVAVGEHLWVLPFRHTHALDRYVAGKFRRRDKGLVDGGLEIPTGTGERCDDQVK